MIVSIALADLGVEEYEEEFLETNSLQTTSLETTNSALLYEVPCIYRSDLPLCIGYLNAWFRHFMFMVCQSIQLGM